MLRAAAAAGKAQARLRVALDRQQQRHQHEQDRRQLRGGGGIVHRQPGAIDPGGESRQAEVGADAVVGQRFHQCERDAGDDRRPRQRQRHFEQAAAQPGTEQARGFHQLHRALAQRSAREQVDIGVQAQHEQDHGRPQAADVGPERAAQVEGRAQRRLHRAAELQRVGIGIGQHIGWHRHRQQQRPLEDGAAREAEQRHRQRRADPDRGHAERHAGRQPERLQRVAAENGPDLVLQHAQRGGIDGQPGHQQAGHWQGQRQAQQRQQDAHRADRPGSHDGRARV